MKTRTHANGLGTAYKRGNTWTAKVIIAWNLDETGTARPVTRSKSGFKTKREAMEYCQTLKANAYTTKNPDQKITLKELYERWVPLHEDRVKSCTMDCYKAAYLHLKPLYNVPFIKIGVDDLQDCIDTCRRGHGTKQNIKVLMTLLYKYAGSREITHHNLAQYLYLGKDDTKTRPAFSQDQLDMIASKIGSFPYADYVYIMAYTGFRPNEMLSLKKEAYHWENGIAYLVGGFKTEAGTNRIVTISPKISFMLNRLLEKADPYIFPDPDGNAMTDIYFRNNVFYPLLAELGIQPIPDAEHPAVYKPYSLRHTFANLMKNVTGSDTDKAALMGHASASMTKYYQSADIESLKNITSAI